MGGLMAMVMNSAMPGVFSHVVLNDIGPELVTGPQPIKGYGAGRASYHGPSRGLQQTN